MAREMGAGFRGAEATDWGLSQCYWRSASLSGRLSER